MPGKLAALVSGTWMDDCPWGNVVGGVMSPPSAMVCADCAGLRRGNTGDSRVVVNEFDVVTMSMTGLILR
jgi:hypothetical protein